MRCMGSSLLPLKLIAFACFLRAHTHLLRETTELCSTRHWHCVWQTHRTRASLRKHTPPSTAHRTRWWASSATTTATTLRSRIALLFVSSQHAPINLMFTAHACFCASQGWKLFDDTRQEYTDLATYCAKTTPTAFIFQRECLS